MKVVKIEWYDAWSSDSGWHTEDELKEVLKTEAVVTQIGEIIYETNNYIILVDSKVGNTDYGTVHGIPRNWIKSIKSLH